jgi:E3 ubiquitin-protein transferase RMND5
MAMLQLHAELEELNKTAKLSDALSDVDKIIELLTATREKIASGT